VARYKTAGKMPALRVTASPGPDFDADILDAMAQNLIHEVIPVGMLQCNCSILGDPATHEAIVVDPGDEVDRILEILRKHKLKVLAIVSTHTHIDHVGGLARLHEVTGAPVLMHKDDLELYRHLDMQAQWLGVPAPEMTNVEEFLREGDSVKWGEFEARVIHTPGHTPGSLCLYLPSHKVAASSSSDSQAASHASSHAKEHGSTEPRLLAGDTIFAGSIGRTDLWGGSLREIMKSLRTKVLALPDETFVLPGHGPATTIGAERENNPFLRPS
jgi:glyoxylase-like metal-dependent hydrolase (beta-lactamase superfamily II)